jgi:hypothetical protein
MFFEQGERFFIQGIRSGGDANGIDQTRIEKGLNFLQIANLIVPMDCCETSAVKSDLSLPVFLIVSDSDERGFDKVSNGRGGWKPFGSCPLIAEETAFTAAQIWEKNRNDERNHLAIMSNYKIPAFAEAASRRQANVK